PLESFCFSLNSRLRDGSEERTADRLRKRLTTMCPVEPVGRRRDSRCPVTSHIDRQPSAHIPEPFHGASRGKARIEGGFERGREDAASPVLIVRVPAAAVLHPPPERHRYGLTELEP